MLAVCDWRVTHWELEEYTFENLLVWFRAGLSIIRCISRATSNSDLSPHQTDTIYRLAGAALSNFQDLLAKQTWIGLEPEESEVKHGRRDLWPGVFPHRLSGLLVTWVLEPLTELYESDHIPADRAVPETLVSTLEEAWYTVCRKFPSPLDVDTISSFYVRTSLPDVAPTFTALRRAAHQARVKRGMHRPYCVSC